MPLIKIFATNAVKTLPLPQLQASLCKIWGTSPGVTKMLFSHVNDWTHSGEDVFVDIRAKGTAERTREVVSKKVEEVQQLFAEHGYKANIRLELYPVEIYHHLPPKQ